MKDYECKIFSTTWLFKLWVWLVANVIYFLFFFSDFFRHFFVEAGNFFSAKIWKMAFIGIDIYLAPLLLKNSKVWKRGGIYKKNRLNFIPSGEIRWSIYIWVIRTWNFFEKTHNVWQFCPCGGSFLPCVSLKSHLWITISPPFLKFSQVDLSTFRAWLGVY